ncbi:DUF2564 family protein [Evansella cellulosilytica]|uniref:DUF2564 family protein n=1 Tax=Evansella cellulosilytica (strain ATCC 21833 / DSM 2522 / FERM P-1141 / JCM 9156 / N-4) TaxID=649639 RepID=E6U292_EVAC2|nr:DUF2564 family protein [Evansella cellulosilytica]ADU30470.1 hypothetical protein Bcell_2210 [Evansella cellulosilytica DSM 2522]
MSKPFDEIHQVEMAIKAAQRTVGNATMNMDPDQLETATKAIEAAKDQLNSAYKHEMSKEFIDYSSGLIQKLEHQVEEAKD